MKQILSSGGIPMLPPGVKAPEPRVLRYTCSPKLYAIPPDCQPLEIEDQGVRTFERHILKPSQGLPANIGDYTITIEAGISTSDELQEVGAAIRELANDLDVFWIYACGAPLNPVVFQISFDVTPAGWHCNEQEIKEYLFQHCKQVFPVVQMSPRHWVTMPYFPLGQALAARAAHNKADEATKALVEIHYSALKSRAGKLFSLAKGLELAAPMLHGRTRKEREASIRPEIRALMHKSLDWLFNVANNRYNVRHIVSDPAGPLLHPRMTGEEIVAFEQDADLILRYVVCERLGIPCPNLQTAKSNAPPKSLARASSQA